MYITEVQYKETNKLAVKCQRYIVTIYIYRWILQTIVVSPLVILSRVRLIYT